MRRGRAGATAAALVLAAAGCASIPDDGAVHTAGDDPGTRDKPYILEPREPITGASPELIASDFMAAMRAQPVTNEDARKFLTSAASRDWKPMQETIVYSGFSEVHVGTSRIDLRLETVARLGLRGAYTPAGGERIVTLTMQKEKGEWRISDLPNAFLVSQTTFEDNYQPLSLYFIDESGRFAVPQPAYLPGGDQLATNAVNGLLRGPSEAMSKVADTYLPEDTSLDVSVRVRDDAVAEVRLAGGLAELPTKPRQLLSAQIVLTLRQVPGVEAVELLVDGVPYEVPGIDDAQDVDAWDRFDTTTGAISPPLFAAKDRQLVIVEDGEVQEFLRPEGEFPAPIGDFGIDEELEQVAVVNESRTGVYVDSTSDDDNIGRTILTGEHILSPLWDPHGWLWLTDAREESTGLAVWRSGEVHDLPAGPLEGMRTRSVSISPDGTRFAAIATEPGAEGPENDAAVYLGLIRRGDDGSTPVALEGVHRVPIGSAGLHAARSVAWRDGANLVVLAEQGPLNAQPYIVAIDGSSVSGGIEVGQPSLPDVGANSIAASGQISDPIYVGDDDGGAWQLDSDQRWSSISDTKIWHPHFPG